MVMMTTIILIITVTMMVMGATKRMIMTKITVIPFAKKIASLNYLIS